MSGKETAATRTINPDAVGETTVFDDSLRLSSAADAAPDQPLPTQFGRYRIRRLLGRGGMGSVLLADDVQLDREVALKIPRLASDDSEKFVLRLLREARAVAALRHPNICPVHDVGEINGTPFLAMAYISGRPLSDYLRSSKPQSERAVALTVYKIAKALEEAHSHGILHRDLKPANVMIDKRGEPIVMDFGLACRVDEEESRLTQEGTVLGTPAYMAPEQIDHRAAVGPHTDVYSLGVLLFELLTRRCPFEGNMVSVIGQVLHSPPPRVTDFRRDISPSMVAIVEKAMAKNPADRYASMQMFAEALSGFLKGRTSGIEKLLPLTEIANIDVLSAPLAAMPAKQWRIDQDEIPQQVWIAAYVVGGVLLLLMLAMLVTWAVRRQPAVAKNVPPPPIATTPVPEPATLETKPNNVAPSPVTEPASKVEPTRAEVEDPLADKQQPESAPAVETPVPVDPAPTPEPTAKEEDNASPDLPDPGDRQPSPIPGAKPLQGSPPPFDLQGKFETADRNRDGQLDPSEMPLHIIFRGDTNKDGLLSQQELLKASEKLKDKLFAPPTQAEMRRLPKPGRLPPRR